MKYLVLGSNSFSGSHLVDKLLADPSNTVVGISRSPEKSSLYLPYRSRDLKNFHFYQCHIVKEFGRLMSGIDDFQPDYIINYVAQTEVYQSSLTPVEYFETNTLAVVKLCSELSRQKYLKRYIHISSAEVYGHCEYPAHEMDPPRPTTPYAVSKAAADYYLQSLFRHSGFPVIVIRSTNVYGKHQQLYKIIPRAVIRLLKGEKIELHDGGRFIRPFIHVRDACSGVLAAIEKGSVGNIYNFAADCNRPIFGVVRLICRKMGSDFESSTVLVAERTGHDQRYSLDSSKAQVELNWAPKIPFEEGLDEVITWIKEHWEEINKEPHTYIHKE